MTQQILIKRSTTAAKVPLATDIASGELAINVPDGKLYLKQTVTGTDTIIEVGAVKSVAGRTGIVTLTSADVGLGNVNNTSDANKPLSSADVAALATKVTNPMTAVGDLIIGSTAGAPTRLAIGTTGQVLTVSGGTEVWSTPASAPVTSVFGRTGAVVLTQADVDTAALVLDGGTY